MTPGTCRYCGCTEGRACEGGCSWADDTRTLCSVCAGAAQIAEAVVKVFGRLAETTAGSRVRLISAVWGDLTDADRQVLVMTCRATAEAIGEAVQEAMDEDAILATGELNAIMRFLVDETVRHTSAQRLTESDLSTADALVFGFRSARSAAQRLDEVQFAKDRCVLFASVKKQDRDSWPLADVLTSTNVRGCAGTGRRTGR